MSANVSDVETTAYRIGRKTKESKLSNKIHQMIPYKKNQESEIRRTEIWKEIEQKNREYWRISS